MLSAVTTDPLLLAIARLCGYQERVSVHQQRMTAQEAASLLIIRGASVYSIQYGILCNS